MSDTDDTDLLLLIPPNFFSIQSSDSVDSIRKKFNSSHLSTLVDDLSNRMVALESHIRKVEDKDEFHLCTNFHDYMNESCKHDCNQNTDKVLTVTSLNSNKEGMNLTELTKRNHLHLHKISDQSEPVAYNEVLDNRKMENTLYANNSFLSDTDSVKKSIEQIQLKLNNEINYAETLRSNRTCEADVNVECYKTLNDEVASNYQKMKNNQELRMRDLTDFNVLSNKYANNKQANERNVRSDSVLLNNFTSVRNDLYDPNTKTVSCSNYTSLCENDVSEKHSFEIQSSRNLSVIENSGYPKASQKIVSLSKILSDDSFLTANEKLENEKLKRQHCEKIIHSLETKVLELEQKVAVAVNVDAQKDELINVLTEAWTKLARHWKQLEEQRHQLVLTLERERMIFRESASFNAQKINDLESKLSTATLSLDDYKKTTEQIEMENKHLMQQMSFVNNKSEQEVTDLKRDMNVLKTENNNLLDGCEMFKTEMIDKDYQLMRLGNKIRELENSVKILTETNSSLTDRLTTEQDVVVMLNKKVRILQNAIDEANKSEKSAKSELMLKNEEMNNLKNTLKDYYQTQLEQIVKEKFQDLHRKLEKAETIVHAQQQRRELELNDSFECKIQQLQSFHRLELKHLKKKNDEQITKLTLEIQHKEKTISLLEDDLKNVSWNKSQLAKQLQKIAHNQWLETLNVIASEPNSRAAKLYSFDLNDSRNGRDVSSDIRLADINMQDCTDARKTDEISFTADITENDKDISLQTVQNDVASEKN